MTSLTFLSIEGIRSFSPNSRQKIQFFLPLTIILGQNGCGKTTIIECLKAATTGIMPPGSDRGRFWIHDPAVLGENEVKAQVRLQFRVGPDGPGRRNILVVRSYSLTRRERGGRGRRGRGGGTKSGGSGKKVQMVFKHFDGAIRIKGGDGGPSEETSAPKKCTEMDKTIPSIMGVSRAILEHVVFCHQEDTAWPLAESSKVKQRFDDIFASTKYSRALKEIKEIQKRYNSEIRALQAEVTLSRERCEEFDRLCENELRESERIGELQSELSELKTERDELHEVVRVIDGKRDAIADLTAKIQVCDGKTRQLQSDIETTREEIEGPSAPDGSRMLTHSDEQIQGFKDQFASQVRKFKNEKIEYEAKLKQLEKNKSEFMRSRARLFRDIGILNAEKTRVADATRQAVELIGAVSRRHGIRSSVDPDAEAATSEDILGFVESARAKIKEVKARLETLRQKNKAEMADVNEKLSRVRQDIRSGKNRSAEHENESAVIVSKIRSLKRELANLQVSEESVREMEDRLRRETAAIEGGSLQREIAQLEEERAEKNDRLKRITAQERELMSLIQERQNEKIQAVRLSDQKEEANNIRAQVEDKVNQIRNLLEQAMVDGSVSSEEQYPDVISRHLKTANRKIRDSKKKEVNLTSRKAKLEGQLGSVQESLSDAKKSVRSIQRNFEDADHDVDLDFQLEIRNQEEATSKLRDNLAKYRAFVQCYSHYVDEAREHGECPICERPFEDSDAVDEFVGNQEEKILKAPAIMEQQEASLEKSEARVRSLRDLKPEFDKLEDLRKRRIPRFENQVETIRSSQTDLTDQIDEIARELKGLDQTKDFLVKAEQMARSMEALLEKKKGVDVKVRELERQLERISSSAQDSMDSLLQKQDRLRNEAERLSSRVQAISDNYGVKTKELAQQKRRLDTLKDETNEARVSLERSRNIQQKIEERERSLLQSKESIEEFASRRLPKLQKQQREIDDEKSRLSDAHEEAEDEIRRTYDHLVRDATELKSQTQIIRQYAQGGKEDRLESLNQEFEKKKVVLADLEDQIIEVQNQVKSVSRKVAESGNMERNVDANLRYRRKRKAHEMAAKELAALKAEQQELAGVSTDVDARALQRKKKKLGRLEAQISKCEGRIETLQRRLREIHEDKSVPRFESVHNRHRASIIKFQTTKAAAEDIQKYHDALEAALMRYHEMKIREINESIKELWQRTYQGNDIDTIELRADKEGSRRRGAYNYRVVMVKGNVSLDMRGRCSAGQKVLASLIIRLALAESFCVDFGVLTLDEPTTNLDRRNIGALADSLRMIIEERRFQSNFQLIVITHDEEFVQKLGRSEFVDHYYRVRKDASQCSEIEKVSFDSE